MQSVLRELFKGRCFFAKLSGESLLDVFGEIMDKLVSVGHVPAVCAPEAVRALDGQARRFSSVLGKGVALHCVAVKGLPESVAAFGLHADGLDISDLDHRLVKAFLMVLVPSHEHVEHLQIAAEMHKFFKRDGTKRRLAKVKNRRELLQIIKN